MSRMAYQFGNAPHIVKMWANQNNCGPVPPSPEDFTQYEFGYVTLKPPYRIIFEIQLLPRMMNKNHRRQKIILKYKLVLLEH